MALIRLNDIPTYYGGGGGNLWVGKQEWDTRKGVWREVAYPELDLSKQLRLEVMLSRHVMSRFNSGDTIRKIAADYQITMNDVRSMKKGNLLSKTFKREEKVLRIFDMILHSAGFRKPRVRVKMGRLVH